MPIKPFAYIQANDKENILVQWKDINNYKAL